MILFPAIDLKDGCCVRLLRGDLNRATIFNVKPEEQARDFANQGFEWLHLVDLNGAVEGASVNSEAVSAVLKATDLPVQLGGGIRTRAALDRWMDSGVQRVMIGTAALADPDFALKACEEYPGRIVIAIDSRNGHVSVEGWTKDSHVRALDLALKFEHSGAASILYTDINRDGAMVGVNVEATVDLAFAVTTPVIASGGVSSIQDLIELKSNEKVGLEGVICGRALYDGRIDPEKALGIFKDET